MEGRGKRARPGAARLRGRGEAGGTSVGLAPLRARAPKGERAHGTAPRNRGKNTTLIASMAADGMGPSVAVEGATTGGAVFEAYPSSRCSTPHRGRAGWS